MSKINKIKLSFCFLILASSFLKTEAVLAFTQGETKIFNINPAYDYTGRSQATATLRQVSDKSLFYVDDEYWNTSNPDIINNAILDLLVKFDKTIYPKLTQIYGSEWSPGIDNETRITILLFKMKDIAGGYFDSSDEFFKSIITTSNEREMIYLNISYLGTSKIGDFLAHEFQHMITFYQKEKLRNVVEDIWLNEARSEYAPTLCGYDETFNGSNLEKRAKEFIQNSSDSLTEWQDKNSDYGPVNLFIQYLVSRYGEAILTKMLQSDLTGIASINQALADSGFRENFNDVFLNWSLANYANNCLLGEGQRYCYLNSKLSNFHVFPNLSNNLASIKGLSFSFSDNIKDWSGHWYQITGGGKGLDLSLNFTGDQNTDFQVPVIINKTNGEKTLRFLKFNLEKEASEVFSDFGQTIQNIVLVPFTQGKKSNFSANEPTSHFSYTVKLVGSGENTLISPSPAPLPPILTPVVNPQYPDGSLIRAKGDFKVYVIMGKYKRWLQTPEILTAYPHLTWQNIIEVSAAERNWYQDSWLIRAEGDYKVYEVNGDGTKHWLNMSPEQFFGSGRAWGMVFVVNKTERDLYRTGAGVLK